MSDQRAVCGRFRLDYFIEGYGGEVRPNMRYCVCGWTQAHHDEASRDDESGPAVSGQPSTAVPDRVGPDGAS